MPSVRRDDCAGGASALLSLSGAAARSKARKRHGPEHRAPTVIVQARPNFSQGKSSLDSPRRRAAVPFPIRQIGSPLSTRFRPLANEDESDGPIADVERADRAMTKDERECRARRLNDGLDAPPTLFIRVADQPAPAADQAAAPGWRADEARPAPGQPAASKTSNASSAAGRAAEA